MAPNLRKRQISNITTEPVKRQKNDKNIIDEDNLNKTKEESENNYNKIIKNIAKKTIIPESEK